jgi:hypothetical protein
MKASDLKYLHESKEPNSLWFSRPNMKFAGDTMANFRVEKVQRTIDGQEVDLYALSRKRATAKGMPAGLAAFFSMSGELVRGVAK